jgi:hypothetical protein
MALISKDNRNWASTEKSFMSKFQELKKVMLHEGFELVYQPEENHIYGYWKGTKHNIQTIVFCIYLDKQDRVFKIEWVNDVNGSYKYDSIIKKIFSK